LKHRLHSFINIFGLAMAIACSILFALFINYELSFDAFHDNGDRIFRINSTYKTDNITHLQAKTQAPLGPALKSEFPEVEYAVRFLFPEYNVKYQNNIFTEKVTFTDPDFFKMFSFNLLSGNPDQVFKDKNTMVVSEEIAKRYFGSRNPIGQIVSILRLGKTYDFTVGGVIENAPENSSIQYDILISFEKARDYFNESYFQNWELFSVITYIQLSNASRANKVYSKIPNIINKYSDEDHSIYTLQPLADVHFAATVESTMVPTSSMTYSFILAGITFLLISIAIFNSMNFTRAMAAMRYKEIGMRKILGAARLNIIIQLCMEAVILTAAAFVIGIFLAELFSPVFNYLVEKSLNLNVFFKWYYLGWGILLVLFTGILSGIYPALILSGFSPSDLYRGEHFSHNKGYFSRSLITVQFILSIFLILCSMVMADQMDFLSTKNIGFNDEQIITLAFHGKNSQQALDIYRTQLKQYASIVNVSGATSYPGGNFHQAETIGKDRSISTNQIKIDYDFLKTFGIVLNEGRDFSREIASDTTKAIIVNQAFVNQMGWKSALGKKVVIEWMGWEVEIVGVMKDFHYSSYYEQIGPLVFFLDPYVPLNYLFIKIQPENMEETLVLLKAKWQEIVPNHPFEYFFLDKKLNQLYHSEERWSRIVTYASIFALMISCFGLFGLTALIMARRTKEIGIRKVVGASIKSIVVMISNQFIRWIILANIIAWPAAYLIMNHWLQNFAYKIAIGLELYIYSAGIVLIVAIFTVFAMVLRIALANPVEALRYE
jgi:putative ABC transport system permease protein